jgi:hypothetical protein
LSIDLAPDVQVKGGDAATARFYPWQKYCQTRQGCCKKWLRLLPIGNFLWALPSKGAQSRANKLASLEEATQHLLTERKMLRTQLEEAEQTKEEESGRTELVERYKQIKERVRLQAAALEVLLRNNPSFSEERDKEAEGACRIACVWTENI